MEFANLSLHIGSGLFAHQVFDVVGGLFLSAIGGAIVWTLTLWRVRGLQVDGEIIGLRRRGPQVHGVYRYAVPGGGFREATSVQGRNSPRGLETGRHVAIQVMPGHPDEARERQAPLLWALSIAFLASGATLLWIGATVSRHGPVVWLLIVPAVVFTARWLWRRVKGLFATIQPIAAPDPWSAFPIESAEASGAASTSTIRIGTAGATSRRTGVVFVVLGVGFLALGAWQMRQVLDLRGGVRTAGTVVELSEGTAGRSSDTFLFPKVQYTAQDGGIVRFDDCTGARPSPFKVGDAVPVVYVPGEPATATIDRGAGNWEPLAGLAVMGLLLIGLGLVAVRRT